MKINYLPLVSVGIPTYNRSGNLKKALDSVINQTYSNIEIIVSDNCSSVPGVKEVMNEYLSDPRVRFIQQERNKGAVFNFNFLLKATTGDYFMWLADDDWLDLNYIELCLNFLIAFPDYNGAYGFAKIHSQYDSIGFDTRIDLEQNSEVERVKWYLQNVTYNGSFSALFKKEVKSFLTIKNVIAADWMVIMRIAFLGKLKLLDTTNKHILTGGQSSSMEALTKNMSLFTKSFPYLGIALNVAKDIVYGSKAYNKRRLLKRCELAKECMFIIIRKYNVKAEIRLGTRKLVGNIKHQFLPNERKISR